MPAGVLLQKMRLALWLSPAESMWAKPVLLSLPLNSPRAHTGAETGIPPPPPNNRTAVHSRLILLAQEVAQDVQVLAKLLRDAHQAVDPVRDVVRRGRGGGPVAV
ncbi:hypothetical protein F751_0377 [Auxenochlorella protothecoides]|uniref:Uncharacterized protein n=1 Tax=Auxenochlorella protothecoides TaxID=3075 RepID=A0A087SBB5_AUXPR|nr:hypothetical protein F751_0377 [Auxenochlorella protothecoides]KFM23019.1 hypothetical protein F751_0377 [Auxenochlorella protothecoides]